MTAAERARVHVWVSGHVQGVGFRYAVAEEARRLSLDGWVRNLEGGAVEGVFEGPRPAVERMVGWLHEGPPGAWVRQVRATWDEPLEGLGRFAVRRTAPG